jgi:hypothetical protein
VTGVGVEVLKVNSDERLEGEAKIGWFASHPVPASSLFSFGVRKK